MSESHTNSGHENEVVVSFIPPNHWWNRANWKIHEEYISHNSNVRVPVGFISDGATIQWFLRWLFSPTGSYFPAAIIHDYIIVEENDWRRANREFRREMEALGVSWFTRAVLVSAVNAWAALKGWINEIGKGNKQ